MEQHPVPQHIASFEFKLFGNLTVRQFVTLAIPMAAAAAIFFSGLPTVIRYTLSLIVALFAFFAALVPIGGRPLDKWLVAFIKAVMSPTQRIWVKEPKIPEFLNIVTAKSPDEEKIPETITSQGRERLRAYLRSLPKGNFTSLDVKEQIAVERLGLEPSQQAAQTLGGNLTPPGSLPPPIIWPTSQVATYASIPQIAPTVRSPKAQIEEEYEGFMEEALPPTRSVQTSKSPRITTHAKPYALPGLERKLKERAKIEHVQLSPLAPLVKAQLASEANSAVENVISIRTPDKKIRLIHGIGQTRVRKLHFAPPDGFDLSKLPIRGEKRFEISQELKNRFDFDTDLFNEEVKRPQAPKPPPNQAAPPPQPKPQIKQSHTEFIPKEIHYIPKPRVSTQGAGDVTLKKQERESLNARISIMGGQTPTVPLPQITSRAQIVPLTSTPNVISGIVTDREGNPIENTIITIKDANGIPVRALKTNKLGQFLSSTPLNDGPYTVDIESDLSNFDPMGLRLAGKVVEPLQIKSKN